MVMVLSPFSGSGVIIAHPHKNNKQVKLTDRAFLSATAGCAQESPVDSLQNGRCSTHAQRQKRNAPH
ncbi:MAG: hypothetical protein II621_09695, partial [Clostridia bacterium]|nr:hypothetical protein [Clostridia bacterium]